jgi:Sodium/hydrogen exchanger family
VVPQIKVIERPQLTDIPTIFEGPRIDKNRYWEAPAKFSTSGLEGQFIEFFQWNQYDYLSMPYVRLRMATFPVQASRVGTERYGALLVGKGIAAWAAGGAFGYTRDERLMVWWLTLPQVAATLAATIVAHDTLGPGSQRLLDDRMLNAVLMLMLTTSILGPVVLTERFATRLVAGTEDSTRI